MKQGNFVYINFSNLNEETQNEIMEMAQDDLDCAELKQEAEDMGIDYDVLLRERAERHLYSYNYVFNI